MRKVQTGAKSHECPSRQGLVFRIKAAYGTPEFENAYQAAIRAIDATMLDLAYTGLRIGDVAILDRQREAAHDSDRRAGASDRHLDRQREDRYACRAAAVADAGPAGNLAFIVTRRGTPRTRRSGNRIRGGGQSLPG